MPSFGSISRRELIRALKQAGFEGPYSGGKHQFMIRGETTIRVPNPHRGDLGIELLSRVLGQASINENRAEALYGKGKPRSARSRSRDWLCPVGFGELAC